MQRLIAASLAVLLGFLLGRGLGALTAPLTRAPTDSAATSSPAKSPDQRPTWLLMPQPNPAAAAEASRALPPEPPIGLRLTDSMVTLRERAEAGNIDAALRLAREQQVCLYALAAVPYLPTQPTRELDLEALRCLHQTHCIELPIGELNPIDALGLAAIAGDHDAAVAYAAAPLHLLAHVTDPSSSVRNWEQQTPGLLEAALQAGHPLALALLAETWAGTKQPPALSALLPAQPARGVSLLWTLMRLPGAAERHPHRQSPADWVRRVESLGLAPESLPELIAEGDRLHQQLFAAIQDFDAELRRYQSRVHPFGTSVWNSLQRLSPACHAELRGRPELRELDVRPTLMGAPW